MDRTAARKNIDREKLEGDALVLKRKAEVDAAREKFNAWEKPRLDLMAAINALEHATNARDVRVSAAEAALHAHAAPYIKPARSLLCDMIQTTRGKVDRYGRSSNVKAVSCRLEQIRQAIDALDALAISGEDPEQGRDRIMKNLPAEQLTFDDETGPQDEPEKKKYDLYIPAMSDALIAGA